VTQPDVSVVVVTWNGRQHLDACLNAVAAQQGVRVETILVDNASTDGTVAYVRDRHPSVRVVGLPENRGFAGGNNAGAAEARAPLVAFLNNDTAAEPGWLQALVAGLDEANGFALATSRIVYMHDPRIIDSAGDGFLRSGGAFKRMHGGQSEDAAEPLEVFGVCGAACLMPRKIFEEIGGFDEDFFASHEDVDLSYRARLLGYRVRYVPAAIVRHQRRPGIETDSRFPNHQRMLSEAVVVVRIGNDEQTVLPDRVRTKQAVARSCRRVRRYGRPSGCCRRTAPGRPRSTSSKCSATPPPPPMPPCTARPAATAPWPASTCPTSRRGSTPTG